MFNKCIYHQEQKLITTPEENNSNSKQVTYEQLIDNTYKVGKKIGSGSYGEIRIGKNVNTGHQVAIKFESLKIHDIQLIGENQTYQLLQGKKGFPSVYYFGQYMGNNVMVMEILGPNLECLFNACGRRLTLKSIIFFTVQLLKRFEVIHQCRILYRDVKPENFMLGINTNTVYIIDFGLSKSYIDSNGRHIPDKQTNELIGTSRYMSVRAHQCKEQSRRDDLEALAYVFIYFLRGKLPWSGLLINDFKQHNQTICHLKRDTPELELCAGFPQEYIFYLQYVRHLEFEEEPNYTKVCCMFKRLFHRQQFKNDGHFDWNS